MFESMKDFIIQNMMQFSTIYATYHGIHRSEKNSTKLRVVFNCSSVTDNRISLNNIQYNDGVSQDDLHALMLKFHTYTHANQQV